MKTSKYKTRRSPIPAGAKTGPLASSFAGSMIRTLVPAILLLLLAQCRLPIPLENDSAKAEPIGHTEAQPANAATNGETRNPSSAAEEPFCLSPDKAAAVQGDLDLTLVHQNRVIQVTPGKEIVINNPRFALLFNMAEYDLFCDRFTAARVMASQDADFIENLIEPPFQIGDTTYLGSGWSMAPDLSMRYDTLFLTKEGMHYLMLDVDGQPIEQRLSIQKRLGPDFYQMRWDIFEVGQIKDDELIPVGKTRTTFAMLFFRDSDLDEIVETGEFMVFYITIDPEPNN